MISEINSQTYLKYGLRWYKKDGEAVQIALKK
jgi:hypothetical protein